MICLEVSRNKKRLCLAGLAEGMWNLDLMVSNPPLSPPMLYVGGATQEGGFEWVREELAVGELVSFQLIEARDPDPPRPSPPIEPDLAGAHDLALARREHEELKARLKTLEARWGSQLGESPDA